MFSRALKLLKNLKPIVAATLLTTGYGLKKVWFSQQSQLNSIQGIGYNQLKFLQDQSKIRKIIEKQVCDSKTIKQGELYFVEIMQQIENTDTPRKYTIAIGRVKGKLYGVLAHCTYKQPLSEQTLQENNFTDAIIFNQKLYCPHHGCAFDIRSGTVQYGPATDNLPRFFVQQKKQKVFLYFPSKIPTSVTPKFNLRNLNDLRKVVIIGGDHNATMGVINGLKLYQYGGQLTIVSNDGEYSYPYRQDLLHRKLINLKKDIQNPTNSSTNPKQKSKKTSKNQQPKYHKPSQIQKLLQQKIYSKLNFHQQIWYEALGIEFIFNSSIFRIINKKFYPYIKFGDGTKLQFDGIVYATGFYPKFPEIQNITYQQHKMEQSDTQVYSKIDLPANIFAPFYNKKQHSRMLTFLNRNPIRNMIVFGMNIQSLQFVQALTKQFPQINVKIIDVNKQNSLTEMLGPDIGQQIIKQFTKRKVQMYIKLLQMPICRNKMVKPQKNPRLPQKQKLQNQKELQSPINSITVELDPNNKLMADCMVLFSNNTAGNTEMIKTAKFVDIDYNKLNDRIIVDPNSRTDTKRMFAAGTCTSLEFFFNRQKIQLINPNVAYEQGMTAGFNLNALNVPFHYIPIQYHKFYGKKLLYAGTRKPFNSMYIMGDVKNWDFIAFYSDDEQVIAVSASESRQKQFQVMRESFRLQCAPLLTSIVKGQWSIPLVYKLIRKLDKSGCYKDLIHQLDPEMNIPDVIWMDRERGSNVDSNTDDETNIEIDQRGYNRQT